MNKTELRKAREVAALTNREGWKHLKKFINSRIKPLENQLFNEDLDKEEFKVIQGKRKELQEVLDFVNRRVKKVKDQNN